ATASHRASKTAGGADVVEVAEVVIDAGEVEHFAEASQGDAEPVRAAEAAELAATFDVRFHVAEHPGYAPFLQLLFQLGNRRGEVAHDPLVGAIAQVGRHEIFEGLFVDVSFFADRAG